MTTKTTGSFNNGTTPPVDAQYLNILRDEMNTLSVIDGTTLDTTGTVNSQQAQAVKAYVSQAGILCTDSGSSANSYILTASSPFTNPPLKTGTRVRFKTANSNTGSSTITPFGGSAITCKKSDGSTALTTGDIPANTEVEFVYNGTNFVQSIGRTPATTTTQGIAFLSNPITISNNATDANNDIDFSAGNGVLDDGSGQVLLSSTLVKRLDASWVAGTNQGGLFSGTKAINTWYYLFAIVNTTTGATDAGFDTSVSGANVPSGWKISKILHAIRTDGSGNILNGTFLKDGWFYFNTSQSEYTTTSTVATNITLSYTPAISSLGHVSTNSVNSGATGVRQTFIGLLSTNLIIGGGVTYGDTYACRENGQMPIPANRSVYVQTAGTGTSTIRTHGFKPLI